MTTFHANKPLAAIKASNLKKLILVILLAIVSFSVFSQSAKKIEKKRLKYVKKTEKLYGSNNYELYEATKKALEIYPDDKSFNYLFSYALYYSRNHRELRNKYTDTELLMKVMSHLDKSKPLPEVSWKSNKFLNVLQDKLFELGKASYLSGKEEQAKEVFNWMQATYYQSNYKYKYDGSSGYSNSEYNFEAYKNPLYCLANTAESADYLSLSEKQLIYLQNLVRINPKLFDSTYLKTYYKLNPTQSTSSYARSLVKDLNSIEKSQLLYPAKAVFSAAEFHANDMGKHGLVGHNSIDGTKVVERFRNYGVFGSKAENCSYGYDEPLLILMQLLIDERIESLGHRKTILNNTYSKVGVAIRLHKRYGSNAVLDYQE